MSTADNLLAALALFTPETPSWTIEKAASALAVSESTALRYFRSLMNAGLLDSIFAGQYVLGPAIMAYDRQMRLHDPLIQMATPVLEALVQKSGGAGVALLCRRFRQQVMCVQQVFDRAPDNRLSYERGRPMGLYRGAASLVVLAHLPSRLQERLWSTDTDQIREAGLGESWPEMREALKAIRKGGALVTHAHLDPGVVGISAPIFQADRRVIGSIALVVREEDAGEEATARFRRLVQDAAQNVSSGFSTRDC